ncbi:MAG: tetratricopeptide repeat protein [Gammaproteobacteria bacterium]|nr:tetratricopeptide repeat protein [Gammaproteobacteria bacterium]MDD9863241.1 tetratricopeptide repeat protein [Gammaproteobacteria bacterium]
MPSPYRNRDATANRSPDANRNSGAKRRRRLALCLTMGWLYAAPAYADFNDGVVAYLQGDYQRSFVIMQALAEGADHGYAMYYLGTMYLEGRGAERDAKQAAHWLQSAAEQGIPQAQFKLGNLYMKGKGLPLDYERAYAWYRVGAEAEHPPSERAVAQAREKLSAEELTAANTLAREYIRKYGADAQAPAAGPNAHPNAPR